MTKATGRKRALVGLTATAMLGLGVFAPAASAQIGTVTDAVGSVTSGSGSSGGGGGTTTKVTDTVKETVKDTTAPVVSTGGSAGGNVVDTVDKVGTSVDTATGGSAYEKTKEVVKNTAAATSDAVNKTAGHVGQTVEETSGGLVTNPDLNVENPLGNKKNRHNKTSGGSNGGPGSKNSKGTGTRQSQIAAAREAARERAADRLASLSAAERNRQPGNFAPVSAVVPERDSFISNLAEAAGEAAKKLAFPLGLALMVGAFLMVQGRIDRKDAKLALAPIDSEQDLLSFQ